MKIKLDNCAWCVYMHINKHTNQKYIGMTNNINERWRNNGVAYLSKHKDGKYHQPKFAQALNDYPDWENDWEHIVCYDNLSLEAAKAKEIELIALYKTNCKKYSDPMYGYNMTDGGDWNPMVGKNHTNEAKQKISEASKQTWSDPEFRQRASEQRKGKQRGKDNPMYGKDVSEDTREKISQSSKERWTDENYRQKMMEHFIGENNPFYGRHHSEETKKKISESKKGKVAGKNNPRYRKGRSVVQLTMDYNFIAEFNTIVEASEHTHINKGNISNACRGWYNSTGGYKWMYKEDYNNFIRQKVNEESDKIAI